MTKRTCRFCGKSEFMTKIIDAEYNITSERRIACFRCQPSMDSQHYGHAWEVKRPLMNDTCFHDATELEDVSDVESDESAA